MGSRKLSIDEVRKRVEERGGTLLSTEFNGHKSPLHILTSDGVEEYRTLASIVQSSKLISRAKQIEFTRKNQGFTIDDVREMVKERGGKCLSDEYLNDKTKILIRTSDGVEEYRSLRSIKTSSLLVSKTKRVELSQNVCRFDEDFVREEIRKRGGELISFEGYENKHSKIKLRTVDGEIEERPLAAILRTTNDVYSKKYNTLRKRKSIEEIRDKIELLGGKLVSEDYTGCRLPLEIICSCGETTYNSIFNIDSNHKEKITCNKCRLTSKFEVEVVEYIESLVDSDIIRNDRKIIHPYELDIVVPNKKLAIECNGVFWHSELYKEDKNYHYNKYKWCKDKEYDLIHVNDVDWNNKNSIVKDIIQKRLGIVSNIIHARKCDIKTIDSKIANKFLDDNHLQGRTNSSYNYGLYHEGELVSVMCCSKSRFKRDDNLYELYRFANKLGTIIVGGFNRLLKKFINEVNPSSIVSYCDISIFSGKVYEQCGFTLSHISSPNYKYIDRNNTYELYSRNKFQKHKLKYLLDDYNENLSEYENMKNNGYARIWDCGNKVYVMEL